MSEENDFSKELEDAIRKSMFGGEKNEVDFDGLVEMAKTVKEMYDSFVVAGFSEKQAMQLVSSIIFASGK